MGPDGNRLILVISHDDALVTLSVLVNVPDAIELTTAWLCTNLRFGRLDDAKVPIPSFVALIFIDLELWYRAQQDTGLGEKTSTHFATAMLSVLTTL